MDGLGQAIGNLMAFLMIGFLICFPLGMWKLIEIVIWCYHHIQIGVK